MTGYLLLPTAIPIPKNQCVSSYSSYEKDKPIYISIKGELRPIWDFSLKIPKQILKFWHQIRHETVEATTRMSASVARDFSSGSI